MTRSRAGRPSHVPTDETRNMVESLSGFGIPQDEIARLVGIDPKTLRFHYAEQIELGGIKATAKVAQNLFTMACKPMGVDLRFHQPGAFGRPGFSPIERCDSAPRRGPPPVHARGGRNAPARHRLSCRWRPHGGTSGPTGVRWEELEHIIRCLASGLQKGGCDSGGGTEAQG